MKLRHIKSLFIFGMLLILTNISIGEYRRSGFGVYYDPRLNKWRVDTTTVTTVSALGDTAAAIRASAGDITAVIAGAGITGGATSGAATVNLDTVNNRNITGQWTMTAPTFTTPTLGAALATKINNVEIVTEPWTPGHLATLNIATDGSLITLGGYPLTFTATGTTNATVPVGTVTLLCVADSTTFLAYTKYLTTLETGHIAGQVFVSKAFTDVGLNWVDVYVTAFDAEDMMIIDFRNVDSVRAVFMVDFVGSGADSVRWVNVADNTQLLMGSKVTGDCDACNTGWKVLPAAFANVSVTIEQQAKGGVATNDPIYKGYTLLAK